MSIGVEYLENEKNKLKEELKRIEQQLSDAKEEAHPNLLKQRKKISRALLLMSDMIDIRKMEECDHIYVMIEETEEQSKKIKECPYCIKCNFDSTPIFLSKIKSVKDAKMRSLCKLGLNSIKLPKGLYLKDSIGYIHCKRDQIKAIYQDIIDQNPDIDDATLGIEFMDKINQKKISQAVKKKNKV